MRSTLSAIARQRISDATKRRWQDYREANSLSQIPVDRECLNCGNHFTVAASYLKGQQRHYKLACCFCCQPCIFAWKNKQSNEERTCRNCGKSFLFYLIQARDDRDGQFCSVSCHWAYVRSQQPEHKCPRCGKVFTDSPSIRRKYCSLECSGRAWINRVTAKCQECGQSYQVQRRRLEATKCCSLACAAKYFARMKRKYDIDCKRRCTLKGWKHVREQVIERDGRKCRVCGSDVILAVHHKEPWRKVRRDDPENLITLCKACHYQVEFVDSNHLTRAGVV